MTTSNRPVHVAGIIERRDGFVLICRPPGEERQLWEFPGGSVEPSDASPEAALRRHATDQVGLDVVIQIGQPPLAAQREGQEAEFRFFVCHLEAVTAEAEGYAEHRWVHRQQLCEYDFAEPDREVAAWYADQEH